MAESILRLKVSSEEYDSKLKRAAEGLNRYIEGCRKAGGTLEHVDDGVKEFTQQLGKMETVAGGARGKLGEMTKAFTDLTMQFNAMSDAEKRGQFGKALSSGLDELKQRIISTKQELADINKSLNNVGGSGGGGLFGGDKLSGMLQVFGGNVMTKIAGAGLSFAGELKDMVAQGIELARQGEGIRLAFERLGRGDILQGLREATHGTVTDLELMKAAVKFNDFKLPLDQLGTMLAFAQQKAKDTGQSVDYLVDSIVTGLGRKSLMILDNLGLSAAQIKERMAETGDMTKAVGDIIREEMQKAGDYVETAADRAAQANVSLQNKMEELGRKFGPLEQASSNLWTSMKIGIMDIVGGPLTEFLNKLTEAGRLAQQYGVLGGSSKVGRLINNLSGAREGNRQSVYQQQQEQFWRYINPREQQIRDIRAWQSGERGEALQKRVSAITDKYGSLDATKIQAEVDAARKMLAEYVQGAKAIIEGNTAPSPTSTTTPTPTGGDGGSTTSVNLSPFVTAEGEKFELGRNFQSLFGNEEFINIQRKLMGMDGEMTRDWGKETGKVFADYIDDPDKKKRGKNDKKEEKKDDKVMASMSKLTSGVTGIFSGIEQMGLEIPEGMKQVVSTLSGLMTVVQSVVTILEVIEALNSVQAAKPLAGGGIVPHAAGGYIIGGNSYSGDNIYAGGAWVNSGELVLNRAQQSTLASQLQGQDKQMHVVGEVQGEKIILVANRTFRRKGQGEIVTW